MSVAGALTAGAATALAVAVVVMALTARTAWRQGRVLVVDIAWGLGLAVIAVVAAGIGLAAGPAADTGAGAGDPWRTVLVAAMVALWGLRLAAHLHRRTRGHDEEDPRYAALLGAPLREAGIGVAVRKVFAVQAVAMALVALPAAAAPYLPVRWPALVVAGLAVWLLGLVFEAVGDAQLASYRSTPKAQRALVLDTGLWRYTRHPNYFGDACVWWGIWLAGGLASGWAVGLLTVLAPVAMTWFLAFATGARLLERTMMQRPGYPDYAARTSGFVPLPPRR